jgi:hypothetical protein
MLRMPGLAWQGGDLILCHRRHCARRSVKSFFSSQIAGSRT